MDLYSNLPIYRGEPDRLCSFFPVGWHGYASSAGGGVSLPILKVQSANNVTSGSETVVVTLDSDPTADNLLIAIAWQNDGNAHTLSISGWQQAYHLQTVDGADEETVACFYKVATLSDTTTITVTSVGTGTSATLGCHVMEFSGLTIDFPLDQTATNDETGGIGLVANTGTTAVAAQDLSLAIAGCVILDNDFDATPTFAGGYTLDAEVAFGGAPDATAAIGFIVLESAGGVTQSTTCTWTGGAAGEERLSGIAVFRGVTTFPLVSLSTSSFTDTASTSQVVSIPADTVNGELLIAGISLNGNATGVWPAGWNEFRELSQGSVTLSLAWRKADGAEGASVTVTASSSQRGAHSCYRIVGAVDPTLLPPEASTGATGSSAIPDPDAITPSEGTRDYLFMEWAAVDGNTEPDGASTNYTDLLTTRPPTTPTAGIGSARRELNASTENPGTMSLPFSEEWVAVTVAVIPVGIFPETAAPTISAFTGSPTAHACNLPPVVDSGDLLLLSIILLGDAGALTTPSGWTQLAISESASGALAIYAKVADGTEDGGTADVVSTNGKNAAAQCYRVINWFGSLAGVEISTAGGGGGGAPDSPSLTASWGSTKNLWFSLAGTIDDDIAYTAAPTNYDGLVSTVSGGGTNNGAAAGSARRELVTATENPGVFTTGAGQAWAAFTVVVRPL